MPTLDVSGGVRRPGLPPRAEVAEIGRGTTTLENRDDTFERLFVTEKRTTSFGDPGRPFCLARTDDELLVLTH